MLLIPTSIISDDSGQGLQDILALNGGTHSGSDWLEDSGLL